MMKSVVKEFGVSYLVHFTNADNLESIFQNGLLSVTELYERGIGFTYNDEYRLDGYKNAICTSIEFPNYKMFYKYRKQYQNEDWVVLGIRRKVLWKKACAFCSDNAANARISSIPIEERMGVNAFRQLYAEYLGKPTRKILGIDKSIPTNPQAEILVFDDIEPSYIWGVAFETSQMKERYKHLLPDEVTAQVVPHLFKYRLDYEHWR